MSGKDSPDSDSPRARRHSEGPAEWPLDGRTVRVTHLDKVFWPQTGTTKGAMLDYYLHVAPVLLPHLRNRPVTLRTYPNGAGGPSYYQRDRPPWAPPWLRGTPYRPKTSAREVELLLVDDVAGLIWLANAGAIEFHPWTSSLPDLSLPDQAIFDLDPGETVAFDEVLRAALGLRDLLADQGLTGYPKTSGGHGLHVVIPLVRDAALSFESVRSWVKAVAERLHSVDATVTLGQGATHQRAVVSIDAAQNSTGRNTAAPYTLRATSAAPVVSTPLTWDEVAAGRMRPTDFTPEVVLDRIIHLGDLFAPVLDQPQRLPLPTRGE